jgi:hypothetical protein
MWIRGCRFSGVENYATIFNFIFGVGAGRSWGLERTTTKYKGEIQGVSTAAAMRRFGRDDSDDNDTHNYNNTGNGDSSSNGDPQPRRELRRGTAAKAKNECESKGNGSAAAAVNGRMI